MMEFLIDAQDIYKIYDAGGGAVRALDGVSLRANFWRLWGSPVRENPR